MVKKTTHPAPPTLSPRALRGSLDNFGNCESTRSDGSLRYRATRLTPGGFPLWIYRIEGADLGAPATSTIVRFSRNPLVIEHAELDEGLDSEAFLNDGYAPSATYESGRIFFAGTHKAALSLLNAFESAAGSNAALARALQSDKPDDGGLEAVLFTWPEGDAAALVLCDTNLTQDRRGAIDELLAEAEALFLGVLGAMESRTENDYTFATCEICDDDAAGEGGEVSARVMLAIFDQDEAVRMDFTDQKALVNPDDSFNYKNLERALQRRELDRSTPAGPDASGVSALRV